MLQNRIHRQVFGDTPIDDIWTYIQNDIPALAQKANVDVIVADLHYHTTSVEVIDITDTLIDYFEPDEKSLKMIRDVEKYPPVDFN